MGLLHLLFLTVILTLPNRWESYTNSTPSIDEFEGFLVDNTPLVECPLKHTFPDGLYVREIFMPKNSIVTTRVHRYDNPFFIMQGDVSVFTEGSEGIERLKAPHHGITNPGTRRVLYTHEDTVWVTVHLNPENETDDAKLVQMHTIPHHNPLLVGKIKLHLGKQYGLLELEEGAV